MPFFYYGLMNNWYFILVVPALLIAVWAQVKVKSTFNKYSKIGTMSGMTGRDACIAIQNYNGLSLPVESVAGSMTDHYDPRTNVIRLSETVGPVKSIAAIGVAAHETGHAIQYAQGYGPIKIRSVILPTTQFASTLAPYLVMAGLIFGFLDLAYVGVAFFGLAMVFQLITLPVEFNASHRAIQALEAQGILSEEELSGAKKVLTAAAMTYVAALLTSLMNFIYLLLTVTNRGRRGN